MCLNAAITATARAIHRSTSRKKCVTLHAVQCRGLTSVGPFHFLLNLSGGTFCLEEIKFFNFTLSKKTMDEVLLDTVYG